MSVTKSSVFRFWASKNKKTLLAEDGLGEEEGEGEGEAFDTHARTDTRSGGGEPVLYACMPALPPVKDVFYHVKKKCARVA